MQPVSLRDTLRSYPHHWLIQTLAPLYSQSLATLEKLSAGTNTCTSSTRFWGWHASSLYGTAWHDMAQAVWSHAQQAQNAEVLGPLSSVQQDGWQIC